MLKTGTVFIVDDDASVRKSLERLIKSFGFNVETFASAAQFILADLHQEPCCLVLDIRMPIISGLELQDELNMTGYDIPIIFITGHGDSPINAQVMKKGAVDFLRKPFEDHDLLAAINKAIEKSNRERSELSSNS
jgi:FixJ family two-component response regulator